MAQGVLGGQVLTGAVRDNAVPLRAGPIDIHEVETIPGAPVGFRIDYGPGAVWTEAGLLAVTSDGQNGVCRLLRRASMNASDWASVPLEGCFGGTLIGYDPEGNQVLVCSPGPRTHPVVQSWSLSGRMIWGLPPPGADATSPPADLPDTIWRCGGAAIDGAGGRLAIPLSAWSSQSGAALQGPVDYRMLLVDLVDGTLVGSGRTRDQDGSFEPRFATLAPMSVVFSGYRHCYLSCGSLRGPWGPEYVWLNQTDAAFVDAFRRVSQAGDPPTNEALVTGSQWPAHRDEHSLFLSGEQVMRIRMKPGAQDTDGQFFPFPGPAASTHPVAGAMFWGDRYVVPTLHRVTALEPNDLRLAWTWQAPLGTRVAGLATMGPEEALVLLANLQEGQEAFRLARISVDGATLQRVPVASERRGPLPGVAEPLDPTRQAVLVDGDPNNLLLLTAEGRLVRIGTARGTELLDVQATTDVGPEGPGVVLRIQPLGPTPPSRLLVDWGDGSTAEALVGTELRHAYAQEGERTIAVMGVYGDGTTATRLVTFGSGAPQASAATGPGAWPWLLFAGAFLLAAGSLWGGVQVRTRRQRAATTTGAFVLRPGATLLGKYEIQRRLGEGSFGQAWLAQELSTRRPVVLKQLRADIADRAPARARFEREARILGALDHANVVRLHRVEKPQGALLLVTEFVEGGSLEDRVRRAPLTPMEAAPLFAAVLEGLAHVHDEGVLHRDIKPSNLLLTRDGSPKLADFGVATGKAWKETVGLTQGAAVGTPVYMAPERLRGEPEDPRSDLYSVAATFHYALTGMVPTSSAARAAALRALRTHAALGAWLEKGMALEASDRFSNAREMLEALRAPSLVTP